MQVSIRVAGLRTLGGIDAIEHSLEMVRRLVHQAAVEPGAADEAEITLSVLFRSVLTTGRARASVRSPAGARAVRTTGTLYPTTRWIGPITNCWTRTAK